MPAISYTHDLPGDTFLLLSEDVAYLKLSPAKTADVDHYLEAASKTKGLIIDIRNYPSEFMVFALGSHFIEKPTAFDRRRCPEDRHARSKESDLVLRVLSGRHNANRRRRLVSRLL
jgi:hypothetical protein